MLPLGCAAFLLFGVVLVVLGACQPGIVASLGLDEAGWGLLGGSLSLGIGAGVLVAGPLVDRLPRRPLFLGATLLTGAALASVEDEMTTARAMLHVVAMGVGAGAYDTLLNAVTVERWRECSVRPLGLLHGMVPVGAVATPALVAWAGGSSAWLDVFRATGAAFFALSLWVACVALPAPAHDARDGDAAAASPFLRPAFLALCVVGVTYVGVEAGVTLFAIPFAEGALGLSEMRGSRGISAFWLGILLGRVAMMLPHERFAPDGRAIALAGATGAVLLGLGTALRWSALELVLGAAGLALAIVFPLMIALVGQEVPESRGTATGVVAGLGSLGGFALPWFTGALAEAHGIRLGVGSLALWCALVALAGWSAAQSTRAAPLGGDPP